MTRNDLLIQTMKDKHSTMLTMTDPKWNTAPSFMRVSEHRKREIVDDFFRAVDALVTIADDGNEWDRRKGDLA